MSLSIDLSGAGCVVLGAGAGIGAATCRTLSDAGARVLCVDNDAALAAKIAAEVSGIPQTADIRDAAAVEAIFATAAERLGRPLRGVADIVGVGMTKPLFEIDEPAWDAQFDINLRHAYHALRSGGRALADGGGGSMVFVGSIAGTRSITGETVYGAAKAALHHLARAAAHELGPRNVRVNVVSPGFVRTPRLLAALPDEMWRRFEAATPLRRTASPEDVATTIAFLLADASSVISGAVVPLDGALSAVAAIPEFRV